MIRIISIILFSHECYKISYDRFDTLTIFSFDIEVLDNMQVDCVFFSLKKETTATYSDKKPRYLDAVSKQISSSISSIC